MADEASDRDTLVALMRDTAHRDVHHHRRRRHLQAVPWPGRRSSHPEELVTSPHATPATFVTRSADPHVACVTQQRCLGLNPRPCHRRR